MRDRKDVRKRDGKGAGKRTKGRLELYIPSFKSLVHIFKQPPSLSTSVSQRDSLPRMVRKGRHSTRKISIASRDGRF